MRRAEVVRHVRVGAFVAIALALLFVMLFVLGKSQGLFVRHVTLSTSFANTAGLVVGAAVRLGGVDVGTVQAIRFAADPQVKQVEVTMRIDGRYLERVRADSVARLVPKGLLGDMSVDISLGGAQAPPLPAGSRLPSVENQGLAEVTAALHRGIGEVADLSHGLRRQVDTLLTPELSRDVGRIVHSAANVAAAIEKGPGLAHALVFDEALARDLTSTGRAASQSAAALSRALARAERVMAAVETGPGSLHSLVYSDDAAAAMIAVRRAAEDLAAATGQIRNGQGPLHALVYGRDGDELLRNLTELSRVLRSVGEGVAQGKGTLGALVQDPSIYEDLKILLRDINRNRLLKALVRFTIRHDGLSSPGTGGSDDARGDKGR